MSPFLTDALRNAVLGICPHRGSYNRQDKPPLVLTNPRLQYVPGIEEALKGMCLSAALLGPEKCQMVGACVCSPGSLAPWPVRSPSEPLHWSWYSWPDRRGGDNLYLPTCPTLVLTFTNSQTQAQHWESSCMHTALARHAHAPWRGFKAV